MPTPSPSPTTPAPTTTTTTTTLTDSATLSGGYNPTGTITFYLFAPGVTPNGTDSNNVYSDTVTVSGNGTYTTASGTNPGGYVPTVAGTYEWVAVYSGDRNNNGVTSALRQRARDGQQGQPGHHHHTRRVRDVRRHGQADRHGVALGRVQPTGTITFYLFAPGTTPNGTDSNNVYATRSPSTATAPIPPAWAPTPAAMRRRRPAPTSG